MGRRPTRIVADVDTIGDDLVLLSLSPAGGRIRTAQKIGYGLMGSELVRLVAAERVDLNAGRLTVRNAAPTGDPDLDAALASITEARRPPRVERWVARPRRGICGAYLERLAAAGYLRKETRVLTRWRIADPRRAADARERLDAIAVSTTPLDLAQAAYGGLVHAIGLDVLLYGGWSNRAIRKHFRQIAKGQRTAAAVPRSDNTETGQALVDQARTNQADVAVGESTSRAAAQAAHHAAADRASDAANQAAAHAASQAAVHAANHAAVQAASQAAVQAASQAAVHAATQAAVHAATQAAVQASVQAAHSAGAAGGHGGHGGH